MSQQSSLTQSARSVRQVLTAYRFQVLFSIGAIQNKYRHGEQLVTKMATARLQDIKARDGISAFCATIEKAVASASSG